MLGDSEHTGPVPAWDHSNLWLHHFFLRARWERRNGKAGQPSLKKTIREQRRARLMLSASAFHLSERAVPTWRCPDRQHTHCRSASCRLGFPAQVKFKAWHDICNNVAEEICSEFFRCWGSSTTASCWLIFFFLFLLRLLDSRVSEEMVSSLKEKILMKWSSEATYIAVGSSPSGGLESHSFVQLHKHEQIRLQ